MTKPNPIPEATHSWHPTETVSMAALRPLVVSLLRVTYPAGSRGDYVHELPVLAEGDGYRVTAHDYGRGAELECSCAAWEPARTCEHTQAVTAKVREMVTA